MKHVYIPSEIPEKPGVYVFRDRFGTVIYVGKAVNLRRRLGNYFQPARRERADVKTRSLIKSIDDWAFHVVRNEEEALILESRLIKDYAPKYNILMRDDKRYPLLRLNMQDKFPTFTKVRFERKNDPAMYFGPFPNGSALQSTLEFILRRFKLRSCKYDEPDEETIKRCMKRAVKDCSAPCCGKISPEDYRKKVEDALEVLKGNIKELCAELDEEMKQAAAELKFEKCAAIRDVKQNLLAVFGPKVRRFDNAELPERDDAASGIAAMKQLQKELGLAKALDCIICFDISNIMGTLAVASMVCFRNGRPDRSSYRHFRIRTVEGSNDFAMMKEAITRHFSRLINENKPLPDLLVVDGGKGQLSSAVDALVEIKCPVLPVIGLAKREEEIFLPGRSESVLLSRSNPALKILQALRDEAHRFAITYHKSLRHKLLEYSVLDEIQGIGEVRKKEILSRIGSVARLKKMTPEELSQKIPHLGIKISEKIIDFLQNKG